jgi:hypothetical protein
VQGQVRAKRVLARRQLIDAPAIHESSRHRLRRAAAGLGYEQQRRPSLLLSSGAEADGARLVTAAMERFQHARRRAGPATAGLLLPFQDRQCPAELWSGSFSPLHSLPQVSWLVPQWALRMIEPRSGRRLVGMDLIVLLLVILIVLALVGSVAVSPLLWALVVILVLFAVLGRGRYYARRG